ncbi:MAG: acyl-CoA reductase [Chthoniobacteraceae bacterium]
MKTLEIAKALALAAKQFPLLGEIKEQDLLDLIKWELGHEEILDGFQNYTSHMAMALGPASVLHIISGNTPHAGLQSLMRGLLLKSHNLCKIPSAGLPEIGQFRDALPAALQSRIEISHELPDHWLAQSDAVIVFGDDETVEHFHKLATRPGQRFIAHGHKVSLGIVFADSRLESVPHAARDVSLFDQQGCLSPHVFYVKETEGVEARQYAAALALEMENFNKTTTRSKISTSESSSISSLRNEYEFRAANSEGVQVWKSAQGTDWTVIFNSNPNFTASCLNRVIFVKPLPATFSELLEQVRLHLSTISIWPATLENAEIAGKLGATRICRIGRMQNPRFTWHQDGSQNLAPLVEWIDFENSKDLPE